MRCRTLPRLRLLAPLLLAVLVGCGGEVPRQPVADLVASLPLAVVRDAGGREIPIAGGPGAGGSGAEPAVTATGESLYLPFGTRVEYFFRLPAGSALTFDGVRGRGGAEGRMEISATLEGGREQPLARLEGSHHGQVELPGDGERALRLTLAAVTGDGDPARTGGMLIEGPALAAPVEALLREVAGSRDGGRETGPETAAVRRRANVVVYMIDTLRADHLGCYGYPRPVSPRIDEFAAGGVLFESAVAQSSWTRPSVASLLTGLWPGTHGVHGRRDTLAPEALTLAEILQAQGYRTAGLVTNRNVARAFGFAQGFELYRMLPKDRDTSADVHRQAADWLTAWHGEGGGEPFFLYLHTVDPHAPYEPPPRLRDRFATGVPPGGIGTRWWLKRLERGEIPVTEELIGHLRDLYDAEIAANDASFGALLDLLEVMGISGETVVILVSDHGEEFYEHGHWEHGKSLYGELLDVPLVVRLPGPEAGRLRGLRVAEPVQHIDLVPTLLAWLGLPAPPGLEGRNLLPRLEGGGLGGNDPGSEVFSHLDLDGFRAAAVTSAGWRLIDGRSRVHGLRIELYDRRRDPREHEDRAAARPVTAGYLRSRLAARELATAEVLAAGEAVLDDELRQQLRALGYLD